MSTQQGDRYQTRGPGPDWRARFGGTQRRHVHDSETRPFFVTSEFLLLVLLIMGLGITASQSASIDARFFWQWTTLASIAYMLSRGFAKSGTRSRAWDPREDLGDKKDKRD
jgi:hypothetical protein